MAQVLPADWPIDPTTTSGTELADLLNRFQQAVFTSNLAAAAPAVMLPGMLWLDTSGGGNGILKMRDAANAAWLTVMNMNSMQGYLPLTGGTMTGSVAFNFPASGYIRLLAPAGQTVSLVLGSNGNQPNATAFDLYQATNGEAFVRNLHATAAMKFQVGGAVRLQLNADGSVTHGASVLSGNVTIQKANAALLLNKAAAGEANMVQGLTAGSLRWALNLGNTTAEGGANAGSDFTLGRYTDAGAFIISALTIARANGLATLTGDLTISKGTPTLTIDKAASGQASNIAFTTNGGARWFITGSNSTAESGGNVGSDFSIGASADGGTGLGTWLFFKRSNHDIYLGNSSKDNALSIVYTDYGGGANGLEGTVRSTLGSAMLVADAKLDALNSASVKLMKNGLNRWSIFASNAAESGSNAGTAFGIARSSDAGSQIDVPLTISRQTGIVTIKTSLAALELADEDGNVTGDMGAVLDALAARVATLEARA